MSSSAPAGGPSPDYSGSQFEVRFRNRNIPSARLIEDLQRVAREVGGSLTREAYLKGGRFSWGTAYKRFGSWNAALAAAGLPTNKLQGIPEAALFGNLAEVWLKLKRQPLGDDMLKARGLSKYSLGTYRDRFGSWYGALLAFSNFINERNGPGTTPRTNGRRNRRGVPAKLRATVLIRDNCICRMCGASPAKDPTVTLHVDHITPVSRGGATTLDNLQTLCATCNIGKADRLCELPPVVAVDES
jgi:hypothetical protein